MLKVTSAIANLCIVVVVGVNVFACGAEDQKNIGGVERKLQIDKILPDIGKRGVDDEFVPYVQAFEQEYGQEIGDISINFGKVADVLGNKAEAEGACRTHYNGRREIVINEDFWAETQNKKWMRTQLIFHELGHCELHRAHVKSMIPHHNEFSGKDELIPESIMYPSLSISFLYDPTYRAMYYNELFGR